MAQNMEPKMCVFGIHPTLQASYLYHTVDKTLALLYSSATTAGIPRDLVRNISLLTDIYHVRAWADKQASRRAAGVWNGLKPPPVEPEKKRKEQPISSRERIQLSAWSALGELVCATETDIGIMAGRQEQMSYGFTRKTMYRPSFPLKKTHLRLYNIVGRSDARPRDLKAGRTLVPSSPLVP